ncbi:MAG: NAD-dependent epimerase/dehydratase family protein, partial [Phycisphaeraceae bacterium]
MPDRPILITGTAGFIGSHLTERILRDGHCVVGMDNFCDFYSEAVKRNNIATAMAHEKFELIEADIRDRSAVLEAFARTRPAAVIHLAAMAGVRPSIERPDYYTQVNINGTVNLLDAAVAANCEKFLFTSSSSVYGNNDKVPFSEDDPVDHPISPYAATKKAGELLCHTYHHLHGLPISCLRLFTVFGPRQRPDLAIHKFLRLVRDGEAIPMFGDGSTSRDYTYVDDIVNGYCAALSRCGSKELPGYRVYNLGGNHPMSLKELIELIGTVSGKRVVVDRKPMQPGDVGRTWADLTR